MLVKEFRLFVHCFRALYDSHRFPAFCGSTGTFGLSQLSPRTCVFKFTAELRPVWRQMASEQVLGGGGGPVWKGRLRKCARASSESKTLEKPLEAA